MSIDKRFALQQTARFAVLDAPGGESSQPVPAD
jgi:hypothetical protein